MLFNADWHAFALELMAQTVGVWSGWHRHQQGKNSIELGMVLGARELLCTAGILPAGQTAISLAGLPLN